MDEIGVFSPEQARILWQDYLTRKQLQPHIQANYPQRRPIDEPSPHRVFVRNDSDEECPGYGCLQITGVDVVGGITVVTCDKPTSTEGEFLFNSPYPIAASGNGWAYRFGIVIALSSGTPPTAANVSYQPVIDSWTIEEGGSLFTVFGGHNVIDDAVIGRFAAGGGGQSCGDVRFQILVADTLTRTALCVITARPYGCGISDIPGTIMEGQAIEVCDPGGCFFNEPNPPLVGRVGWAKYMMPIGGSTWCQPNPTYGLVPEWEVHSLCCAVDSCML